MNVYSNHHNIHWSGEWFNNQCGVMQWIGKAVAHTNHAIYMSQFDVLCDILCLSLTWYFCFGLNIFYFISNEKGLGRAKMLCHSPLLHNGYTCIEIIYAVLCSALFLIMYVRWLIPLHGVLPNSIHRYFAVLSSPSTQQASKVYAWYVYSTCISSQLAQDKHCVTNYVFKCLEDYTAVPCVIK